MRVDVAAMRSARSWARQRLNTSETILILVAVAIGGVHSTLSVVQDAVERTIQHVVFALPSAQRLSATSTLPLPGLIAFPVGGITLALFFSIMKMRARHGRCRRDEFIGDPKALCSTKPWWMSNPLEHRFVEHQLQYVR